MSSRLNSIQQKPRQDFGGKGQREPKKGKLGIELEDEILGQSTATLPPPKEHSLRNGARQRKTGLRGVLDAVCTPGSSDPCTFLVILADKFLSMLKTV